MRRLLLPALLALTLATPVLAVRPDEILSDPALEARARALSQNLRCLVCRNENIDDSDADLAHDLRVLLRERLVAGDTDDQAMSYLVDRYGEFVLLKPTTSGANLILWLAGPLALVLGGGIAWATLRRRSRARDVDSLTEEEADRVAALLKDQG